jgi:hypothetical protein
VGRGNASGAGLICKKLGFGTPPSGNTCTAAEAAITPVRDFLELFSDS